MYFDANSVSHFNAINMINNLCIGIITNRYALYNTELKQFGLAI